MIHYTLRCTAPVHGAKAHEFEGWFKDSAAFEKLLAAGLMVGFDACVEPVAGHYDFWHWTANLIPMQNFRDWFILSCVLQMLFNRANFTKLNPLVPLVYLAQLLFFFLLGAVH